jgi:hypothetical protein
MCKKFPGCKLKERCPYIHPNVLSFFYVINFERYDADLVYIVPEKVVHLPTHIQHKNFIKEVTFSLVFLSLC